MLNDDQQLASGGNDNKLLLWCARSSSQPLAKFNLEKVVSLLIDPL